ncbi:MAG TPA: P1 family peptidase [Actinomycetota bacterium]|nr:P1 family peptidase [Actinomycetota bacterium]
MTTRLLPGFRIGHWSDPDRVSGCSVVLPPRGNVTSCDVRGSSPGSRELTLLDLDRRLTEVHGILLTGGSAFGLAAATGVVEWLEEHGIGYETAVATIPIVPAAVVFDLGAGSPDHRPGAEAGRSACEAAVEAGFDVGRVGAGTGATVGKWAGREHAVPGGFGVGHASHDGLSAAAVAVVNSVGDVIDADGRVVAGTSAAKARMTPPLPKEQDVPMNTVLAVVAVEARLDKQQVRWLAGRGSDGITTSVRPAHTRYDGDVVFALAVPPGDDDPPADPDALGPLVTAAVAEAVRSAVRRPPENDVVDL